MINEFERKMKTRQIWGIFPLAAMVLMMGACSNDEFWEGESGNGEQVELVPMTFTAGMAQTRTELVEQGISKRVKWQQGDVISILNLGEGQQVNCPFTTQDNDFTATFTGEAPEADAYLAVYPYQDGLSGDYDSPYISLKDLTFKSEQQAVDGSFDPNAHLAAGYVSSSVPTLVLKNLCTLVKFRMDGDQAENVTKVVFSGQGNESLAAKSFLVTFSPDAVDRATFSDQTETSTSITLEAPEDGFKPHTDYYIAVLPNTLKNGFKLEFHLNGDEIIEKIGSNEATLKPNYILNLGKITVGKLPDAKITNTDFIKAVEEAVTNIGWTVAEDGTVTLDENNLAKVEAVERLYLENMNLTDLSGIEYFTNLKTLSCNNNNLQVLDVSKLKSLKTLRCSSCGLTSLNVEGLSNLWELTCTSNNLTSLDLSGLNVGTLQCAANLLETLDISEQTNLKTLSCGSQKEGKKLTLTVNADQMTTWENTWSKEGVNSDVTAVSDETN